MKNERKKILYLIPLERRNGPTVFFWEGYGMNIPTYIYFIRNLWGLEGKEDLFNGGGSLESEGSFSISFF